MLYTALGGNYNWPYWKKTYTCITINYSYLLKSFFWILDTDGEHCGDDEYYHFNGKCYRYNTHTYNHANMENEIHFIFEWI